MPEDDILLCHILKCKPIDLLLNKRALTPLQEELFKTLKQRRRDGEPLQYIIGQWDFCGLTFKVNPDVLVPRPETEVMVEQAIAILKNISKPTILDLGTGSGCIAIAIANFLPGSKVTAIDISPAALTMARDNAELSGVSDQVTFIQSDMKKLGSDPSLKLGSDPSFDLIISNPPYIPSGNMESLPLDVKQEPRLALDGGSDGLDFYRILIKMTPGLIKRGGYLMMEFGDGQAESVRRIAESQFNDIKVYQDFAGKDRFVRCS